MDFQDAMRQAERIASAAEKLSARESELQGHINVIRAGWTGENAELYLRKLETSKANIRRLRDNLTNISDVVKRNARRTYETEMATLEISQRRSYH